MLDFTSALYLGFSHPGATLARSRALTLGRPAALEVPPGAERLAADLADLTGMAAGQVFPSTLHLFHDVFSVLAGKGTALLVDAAAYPIARWGMQGAQLAGAALATYPHHDAAALARKARRAARAGLRPIVVTDGVCPSCGRLAPLPDLADAARACGGCLVVDDTQAVGVIGAQPGGTAPLGLGGGGSLAWHRLHGPHVLAGMSLAKAFGAPLAVLVGDAAVIARVKSGGETRVHCSPPAIPVVMAARLALSANRDEGDALRARLVRRVMRFRRGLSDIGADVGALPLPVQTVALPSARAARIVSRGLQASGIRAAVTPACRGGWALTVVLTALHAPAEIDRLIDALATLLPPDADAPTAALSGTARSRSGPPRDRTAASPRHWSHA